MRLQHSAHTERPWRIHEIAPDFTLLDVWALPTPGGAEDFPLLVNGATMLDPGDSSSVVVRLLFSVRWKLGEIFGWDDPSAGLGSRVSSLRERLPDFLRGSASRLDFEGAPFVPLYLTEDEFAAEIANQTVHGILHLGWVEHRPGSYRGQMAVLVKPNGLLGTAYMMLITPFRHLLVYPALLRDVGKKWETLNPAP